MAVLEEFLIKLGYQIDQASQKNFVSAIGEGIEGVTKFAGALVAMAIAVEEAVRRTAYQMARLQTSADLGGKPASQMKILGDSLETVGGSYQEANDQQIRFHQTMLNSPWLKGPAQAAIGQHSLDMKGVIERYHELRVAYGEGSTELVTFMQRMADFGVTSWNNAQIADKHWDRYQEKQEIMKQEAVTFQKRWDEQLENALRLQGEYESLTHTVGLYFQGAFAGLTGLLADATGTVEKWLVEHEETFNKYMDHLEEQIKAGDWAGIGKELGTALFNGIIDYFGKVNKLFTYLQGLDWDNVGEKIGDAIAVAIAWVFSTEGGGKIAKAMGEAFLKVLEVIPEIAWKIATGLAHSIIGHLANILPFGIGQDLKKSADEAEQYNKQTLEPNIHRFNPFHILGNLVQGNPALDADPTLQWASQWGKQPHAAGGIVPSALHAGEMVLPQNISSGIQNFFGDTGWSDSMDDLSHWLTGDATFAPLMAFADTAYDKLTDVFEEALRRVWPDAESEGVGGGGKGGGGGAGGGQGGGEVGSPLGPGVGPDYGGKIDRSQFEKELAASPELREKVLKIAANEQGSNPQGTQAVLESMMNRAQVMGTSLAAQAKWVTEHGYYDDRSHPGGREISASQRAVLDESLKKVLANSNISNYATDNASADLAERRIRNQEMIKTFGAGGETFFRPGGEHAVSGAGVLQQYEKWRQSVSGGGGGGGEPLVPGSEGRFSSQTNLAKVNQTLVNTLAAASKYLPEGYRVVATSGESSGHASDSEHHPGKGGAGLGNALDVKIVGPGGALPNEGAFGGGAMYAKLAHAWYNELAKQNKEGLARWGGEFESSAGSGLADYMHYDLGGGGRRGRHRRNDWAYVDNSTNTTVINGTASAHDIHNQMERQNANRTTAYGQRNGGTYYS
jgi:hypothetical protein